MDMQEDERERLKSRVAELEGQLVEERRRNFELMVTLEAVRAARDGLIDQLGLDLAETSQPQPSAGKQA
jgi:hypothetical protein